MAPVNARFAPGLMLANEPKSIAPEPLTVMELMVALSDSTVKPVRVPPDTRRDTPDDANVTSTLSQAGLCN